MNVHESEKISGLLKTIDCIPTDIIEQADIIVFNTCCIRATAEQKIIGNIGELTHLKQKNPNLIIAICGCMTQLKDTAQALVAKFNIIDIILGTTNLDLLPQKISEIINNGKNKPKNPQRISYCDSYSLQELPIHRTSGVNAWVNIIYGCDNFCSYCIVPYVRGRQRSRSVSEILNEISDLLEQGYKEITLLGQNVNSYGLDLSPQLTFAQLLELISQQNKSKKFRLRFMTSHPKDFTDECIRVIKQYDCICKSVHLPIQSGSDNILNAMNRKYNSEYYISLVNRLRHEIPNISITTDIMVGFPNESQQDFLDTISLVEKIKFNGIFTFIYSSRKGTPAALMPQISYPVKQERIKKLIEVQNNIVNSYSTAYIGSRQEVLIEAVNANKSMIYTGRSDDGRLISVESETNIMGQFVKVIIVKSRSSQLIGKLI